MSGFSVPFPLHFMTRFVRAIHCLYSFWSTEPASWMTILLLDYILYMRVMALFSQDEKLAIWLKSLFGLEAAFTLGILLYESLAEGIAVETLAKGVTICEVEKVLPVMWPTLYWAGPLAYEFILMVLALYKAADFWRSSAGLRGFGLVKVIVQDQAIYFLLVISCGCCKIISFHLATFNLLHDNLFDTIGGATLLCVLGSRLLVNLKEAGERGVNGGTSYRASTMSNMEFS
ncbi:hypothetical protein DFH11DRAFT_1109847 [Phellopilus nigrolimitatus]|nr:hypothetical protein DFH11DRAFT_1109847 [Phellopilus nigrolimitatus]